MLPAWRCSCKENKCSNRSMEVLLTDRIGNNDRPTGGGRPNDQPDRPTNGRIDWVINMFGFWSLLIYLAFCLWANSLNHSLSSRKLSKNISKNSSSYARKQECCKCFWERLTCYAGYPYNSTSSPTLSLTQLPMEARIPHENSNRNNNASQSHKHTVRMWKH